MDTRAPLRLVLSMTTLPGREALLARAVASLSRQTRPPDAFYLWLPAERFGGRYPALDAAQARIVAGPDPGPAMKLLPALDLEPDPATLLVTVDDDVEYPPELLAKLEATARLVPDQAVGFTGWSLAGEGGEPGVIHWNEEVPRSAMLQPVEVLEGYRGVAYRRGFFDARALHEHLAALDAFRYHDDILFGGYLASRGIGRVVRWFGLLPVPAHRIWGLLAEQAGLHIRPGWHQNGVRCVQYWNAVTPGCLDGAVPVLHRHQRLQLEAAATGPRPGFLHHGSKPLPGGCDIVHPLASADWPWADGALAEVLLADAGDLGGAGVGDLLERCRRSLKPGGLLKLRMPEPLGGRRTPHPAGLEGAQGEPRPLPDALEVIASTEAWRLSWERSDDSTVATIARPP